MNLRRRRGREARSGGESDKGERFEREGKVEGKVHYGFYSSAYTCTLKNVCKECRVLS